LITRWAVILGAVCLGSGCGDVESPLPDGATADHVIIEKSKRELTLLSEGKTLKSYHVALGRNPTGAKTQEGDNRTPEGVYLIDSRKSDSGYHRALHLSYPNAADLERARGLGVEPGGDIMIHGIRNGFGWVGRLHRLIDWTRGCIAVTDGEIQEMWRAVPNGAVVEIRA